MKVTTLVEFSEEVEVDVSKEELLATFSETPDPGETWFVVLNRFAFALNALTDDIIAEWTKEQQKTVADFLYKHMERFSTIYKGGASHG